jgi:hypothetical protein
MIARYDVDPNGDVRAILAEPSCPFAPAAEVGKTHLTRANGDGNGPADDDGNGTEVLTSDADDGKYYVYRIT